MAYTQTTLGDLINALSIRLSDTSFLFWTQDEMRRYIIEALHTWQAMSAQYTSRVSFNTVPLQLTYDLYDEVPSIAPTITDRNMIVMVEECLQEAVSSTTWAGTEQFSFAEMVQSIQRRRDKFIVETGIVLQESNPVILAGSTTLNLNQSTIDVRRVMWKGDEEQLWSLLWKADNFTLVSAGSRPAGTPVDFSTALEAPVTLRISPETDVDGTLNLITTNSGVDLNPGTSATILGIPDDLCWVVKYGVLADLLSQSGQGQDLARAAYAESRWRDGIKLARIWNLVKFGYQDTTGVFIDSMFDIDANDPTWVFELPNSPQYIGVAGNIICAAPIPDNIPMALGFDVSFMPMPASDIDYVQVGAETLNVIIDYAEHLASFKEGMSEISPTIVLYQNMIRLAATMNDRLRAAAQNFDVMSDRSIRENKNRPRRNSDIQLGELNYKNTDTEE